MYLKIIAGLFFAGILGCGGTSSYNAKPDQSVIDAETAKMKADMEQTKSKLTGPPSPKGMDMNTPSMPGR